MTTSLNPVTAASTTLANEPIKSTKTSQTVGLLTGLGSGICYNLCGASITPLPIFYKAHTAVACIFGSMASLGSSLINHGALKLEARYTFKRNISKVLNVGAVLGILGISYGVKHMLKNIQFINNPSPISSMQSLAITICTTTASLVGMCFSNRLANTMIK